MLFPRFFIFMDILGHLVFYRSYSRRTPLNTRESFEDMASRVIQGLGQNLGLTELYDVVNFLKSKLVFPSGRYLWVGGTEWLNNPDNYQVRIIAHPLILLTGIPLSR